MKKYLFIFAMCLSLTSAYAQHIKPLITINRNSVVRDTSGMQYPFSVWQKLYLSGNYRFDAVDPNDENTDYIISKKYTGKQIIRTPEQEEELIRRMQKPAESTFFTTGEVLKPFKVTDITGTKISPKDWVGKIVVINFWFINCLPCRKEIPELNKMAIKYANNPDVIFIGIALDRKPSIDRFIAATPFAYHQVEDGEQYASLFKIHLYPTNVVIDKEGKVRFHSTGYTLNTPYWIEKTIAECNQVKPQ
jgi:thiol-disulfide isomerase/thioredoxin